MRSAVRTFCRLPSAAWIGCFLWAVASQASERNSSYLTALESIRTDQLRQHVEYLADDRLEGREAGSRGGRAAGEYLASRLAELQLPGAGTDGGYLQSFPPNFRNVLALLPGSDPTLKDRTIIVSAHYDHIGYGSRRRSRGAVGFIHNGADDNASGTSALLELAEAYAMLPERPKRSILFAFWDAEEKGLLGSKHWVRLPTLALENVTAVVNMDMVGRLREDCLVVFGSRTGYGWRRLVSRHNELSGLRLSFPWTQRQDTDYYPFFARRIPVLLLHTGVHDEYHTSRDDVELINSAGLRRVARLAFALVHDLADEAGAPVFRQTARRETEETIRHLIARAPQPVSRLGVGWRRQPSPGEGVRLTRVAVGSPAERAGLRPGDRIVQFAGREIRVDDDLAGAVMRAESPASVVVKRPGREEPLELMVSLRGNPMRLGISWRVDDAEPGTVILTHVVAGSPAAHAGLRAGDRIYQIGGHDFADQAQFAELARTLPAPLELLVERDGQLRTVELQDDSPPLERAA